MKILGVDPALSITGYGLIDVSVSGIVLLEAGVIKTASRDPMASRLLRIYRAMHKLITDTSPQVMVLEKVYVHYGHPTTAFLLGQARGVICLAGVANGLSVAEYAATRIKKAIVGNGRASKSQVQRMVMSELSIRVPPAYTDVTDALALALAHSAIARVDSLKGRIAR